MRVVDNESSQSNGWLGEMKLANPYKIIASECNASNWSQSDGGCGQGSLAEQKELQHFARGELATHPAAFHNLQTINQTLSISNSSPLVEDEDEGQRQDLFLLTGGGPAEQLAACYPDRLLTSASSFDTSTGTIDHKQAIVLIDSTPDCALHNQLLSDCAGHCYHQYALYATESALSGSDEPSPRCALLDPGSAITNHRHQHLDHHHRQLQHEPLRVRPHHQPLPVGFGLEMNSQGELTVTDESTSFITDEAGCCRCPAGLDQPEEQDSRPPQTVVRAKRSERVRFSNK